MSGNGNGNTNGNGTQKRTWNLRKDGILWKRVLDYSTKEFQKQAEAFVAQLQDSVQPADALQGLLLDRMAASYLRQHLMLETEGAAKEYYRHKLARNLSKEPEAVRTAHIAADLLILQAKTSMYTLRYEALLEQGFHRDLILLQKLKEMAPVPAAGDRKSLKPERGLIEGESIVS